MKRCIKVNVDVASDKEKRRERFLRKRRCKYLESYRNKRKWLYDPKREV